MRQVLLIFRYCEILFFCVIIYVRMEIILRLIHFFQAMRPHYLREIPKVFAKESDIYIRHAGKQCKTDGSGLVLDCFFVP